MGCLIWLFWESFTPFQLFNLQILVTFVQDGFVGFRACSLPVFSRSRVCLFSYSIFQNTEIMDIEILRLSIASVSLP